MLFFRLFVVVCSLCNDTVVKIVPCYDALNLFITIRFYCLCVCAQQIRDYYAIYTCCIHKYDMLTNSFSCHSELCFVTLLVVKYIYIGSDISIGLFQFLVNCQQLRSMLSHRRHHPMNCFSTTSMVVMQPSQTMARLRVVLEPEMSLMMLL